MPELPPEPIIEPPPRSADKLDIMSRNCSELKKTLAVLQGQMNAFTAEKANKETTPPVNAQPKKSKNKKNKNKSCPIKERGNKDANDKIDDVGEVSTSNENIPVVADSIEESETKLETEVQGVDESIASGQNDNTVSEQTTEDNIKGLIDDLAEDVQTKCDLESQSGNEIPAQIVNGENGDASSTTPETVATTTPETVATITPETVATTTPETVASVDANSTESNNEEPAVEPVNASN